MNVKRFSRVLLVLVAITMVFFLRDYGLAGEDAHHHMMGEGDADHAMTNSPSPLQLQSMTYPLGGYPRASALGDIDSDGDMDIAVTNADRNNVVILLNKGDGTFETGKDYPVEGYPIAIALADIDGDHDMDMIVLDSDGMVRTLIHGEDGAFSPGGGYPVRGNSFSMTLSDVNRDRNTDILVLSPTATTLLINDGKGGFKTRFSYENGVNPVVRITDDLNMNGEDDIVIGGSEGISVLLDNGDETFQNGVWYATGKKAVSAASGDIDLDNYNDLFVVNYKDNTLSVLRNNGDGTLQDAVNYPSGKGPNSITIGDIDSDEDLDIIVTNGLSGDLSIFINETVRPLSVTTGDLPKGRNGQYYEALLEAEGGVPPYTWSVVSGSLPGSLHLDPSTGSLVSISHHGDEEAPGEENPSGISREGGEPLLTFVPPCYCLKAAVGLYRFAVQVTDSSSKTAAANLQIEVFPGPGTIYGNIQYSGEKKGKIRIGLWPSGSLTTWMLGNPIYISHSEALGEYTMGNIYPESYLISAFMDVNGDGRRQGDEPYGVFGKGGEPKAVLVNDGAMLTGIDIELIEH